MPASRADAAPRGRVRPSWEAGAELWPGSDLRTGENPPSKSPAVAVMSAAAQSQKPGSGPCRKSVRAIRGTHIWSTVKVVIPSTNPDTFWAGLPPIMAMKGAAITSACGSQHGNSARLRNCAVKPKIAGNPFAFALDCAGQEARAKRRTARVRRSIWPRGARRTCRLCSGSRSWFVGSTRTCRATFGW